MFIGKKKLLGAGTNKTVIVPSFWRKSIGNPEYFDVNIKKNIMTVKPHKE